MKSKVFARIALFVAVAAPAATGCRSHASLRPHYLSVRDALMTGNFADAANQIEQAKARQIYTEDDRVMYWLNLATAQHYAKQWSPSQQNFVSAEKAIKDLWTTSISDEAGKLLVSETLGPYKGEDYEKILLYYFTALNNFEQGKISDALIEARRADEFLKEIQARYDSDKDLSSLYKEDAFMLWLVGLLYEIEGSHNDAYLAYKRSYKIYQRDYQLLFATRPPSYVAKDVVRSGIMANLRSDAESFAGKVGVNPAQAMLGDNMAEIIFIHGAGEAPHKKERSVVGYTKKRKAFKIALPQLIPTTPAITRSSISVAGQSVNTEMAEPIVKIAMKNFEHQKPVLTARALARAAIKVAAAEGTEAAVGGSAGRVAGILFGTAAAIAENADLRGWTLLPAFFRAARVAVPAGQHTVQLNFPKAAPQQLQVNLKPGERKIISVRTIR